MAKFSNLQADFYSSFYNLLGLEAIVLSFQTMTLLLIDLSERAVHYTTNLSHSPAKLTTANHIISQGTIHILEFNTCQTAVEDLIAKIANTSTF